MIRINKKYFITVILSHFILFFTCTGFAAEQTVHLTIGYKQVHFAGQTKMALAVNHQIPAPTLHFKEGDRVHLFVHNTLKEATAIHWHGLLVPWQMDGVEGVTQRGIPPGGVFHYDFTLLQSGTYWYHAHAGLQEQLGLYGAFIIDPLHSPHLYDKDYVIVLSDWSNTNPKQILANLKKTGSYYSSRFPLQPSLFKFIQDYRIASSQQRRLILEDYKMMQSMRMSLYDISDVVYDAFLLNGHTAAHPWTAPVKVGDTVRLRFIGAAGSTIFRVKIPHTTMQIIQVEGNDVRPYRVNDFSIAPGETYDVLIKIKKNDSTIIYAESIDAVGAAYGALVSTPGQPIHYEHVSPFPTPLPPMRAMMSLMADSPQQNPSGMNHSMMNHTGMNHSTSAMTHTKYQPLIAAVKTNDPNKPVDKIIRMELYGYMDRFIWFINGVPEDRASPILLKPNKRYRFIFTNPSMMRHPMHMHGHWFILRNGHGAYDPLLHTLDIPPGATLTADVDTDASGQWLFHCHLLYHMMGGMSRVFQYTTLIELTKKEITPEHEIKTTAYKNRPIVRVDESRPLDLGLIHHPMPHVHTLWFATFLDVSVDPFNNTQRFTYKGLYGRDYDKLELFINDAEISKGKVENADMDIFYWHLIDEFWVVKAGLNYFYRPTTTPYWQPGISIEGLMPYFIDTDVRLYYYSGAAKLDLEFNRDTQLTNQFFIRIGLRSILATQTIPRATIGSGLNQMHYIIRPFYRLMPGLSLFAEYEIEQGIGTYKKLLQLEGDPGIQHTFSLGLSMVL